jgi:hypothetical protein
LSDTEREMRAEYVPTADQRALVENAAALASLGLMAQECSIDPFTV